ncbi:MAG: hypothetical protein H6727_12620 [Myxococcales bacterium]|nr:hypothetical protein [Myxococcales bacterium]
MNAPSHKDEAPLEASSRTSETLVLAELPAKQHLSYRQRLFQNTALIPILVIISPTPILIIVGMVIPNGYFVFIGLFLNLNLLNYLFFRKQVRHLLKRVEIQGNQVLLEFDHYDDLQQQRFPLEELGIKQKEDSIKGGTILFLSLWRQDQKLLEQSEHSDTYWTRQRLQKLHRDLADIKRERDA